MGENKSKEISAFLVCIICFFMGVCVPITYTKLTSNQSTEWKKLEKVYSLMKNRWYFYDEIEDADNELVERAISGMTKFDEDRHTNYFSLEQAQLFSKSLEGSSVGIGITYYENENHELVVKNVFMNSPADQAGLQPGDVVKKIDDMKCSEKNLEDIVAYIQDHAEKEINVYYTRDEKEASSKITPTTYDSTVICNVYDDYGEIILTSFSETSGKDFDASMKRIQKAGIKKLIIDLRGNTGGYLTSVLDISSVLFPKDTVVFREEDKDGNMKDQISSNKYEQISMDKIVVLQNGNTASASEVLIGELKDYMPDVVTTVGTTSYGKGTEQVSVPFTDGTSLKYTIAKWYTPNGLNINDVGFEPDVKVDPIGASNVAYAQMEEDEVYKKDTVFTNARATQVFLKFLGYSVDREDTYFSLESSKSLEQFQRDHNLDVTGDLDYQTWNTLTDEVLNVLNNNYLSMDLQRQKAIEILQ